MEFKEQHSWWIGLATCYPYEDYPLFSLIKKITMRIQNSIQTMFIIERPVC